MGKIFGGTILVVEDEPVTARISRKILEKYGYSVIHAESGEEGIEAVKRGDKINLVLMDIDLGEGMDGTDAAEEILKNYDIPVVFYSSHTEPEIVEKTEGITSYGYIVKNSGETVLIASLKMAFRLFESKQQELEKEKKLLEGEERNRALLEGIPDLMFLFSKDGVFLDCSVPDETILLMPPELFINRHVSEVLSPELAFLTIEKISRALSFSEIQIYEYQAEIDKSVHHYESRLVPCGENKTLAIVRDITEQKKADEALKEAEGNYRNLFMNSHVGIYRTDVNTGCILEANDMFARIFGFKDREDILSAQVSAVSWYADPEVRANMISILKQNGEVKNYEAKLKRRDGSFFWIHFSGRLVPGKGWIEGVLEDITEKKNIEEALKKRNLQLKALNEELASINEEFEAANEELIEINIQLEQNEQNYRILFENTGSGITLLDAEGTIKLANEMFARTAGYSREEIEGKMKWTSLVHPDDAGWMMKQHRLRRENPGWAESSYEFRFKTRTGEIRDMLLYATVIPGTSQSIASIFDITDRKLAERKLLISENKYRKIFENVQDVFYQTDLEGTIIEISPSIEKYAGFTRDELIGSPVQNVYYDLSDRDRLIDILKSDGKVVDYELCLKTKWNRPVITSASSHLILNSSGNPVGIEGSLRDITARKSAEDRVKSLLYEKEILLKETHHRVKNNMNAVYGMLFMQSEEINNPECRAILKDAASRVHSMTVLYDKLYRSSDYREMNIAEYIPPLVEEISSIFDTSSMVKFELAIEDFNLGSKVLSCLGIIINELITNSMKYAFNGCSDGVISITASKKSDEVTVVYRDNGVGIPESQSFENSTGFGMQLLDMLVKQVGGSAEINRDSGTGFIFNFRV